MAGLVFVFDWHAPHLGVYLHEIAGLDGGEQFALVTLAKVAGVATVLIFVGLRYVQSAFAEHQHDCPRVLGNDVERHGNAVEFGFWLVKKTDENVVS